MSLYQKPVLAKLSIHYQTGVNTEGPKSLCHGFRNLLKRTTHFVSKCTNRSTLRQLTRNQGFHNLFKSIMHLCRAWHHNIHPTRAIQALGNPGALHQYPGATAMQVGEGPNEASTCFSPGFEEASVEGSYQIPLEEKHSLIFYLVVKISQWYISQRGRESQKHN